MSKKFIVPPPPKPNEQEPEKPAPESEDDIIDNDEARHQERTDREDRESLERGY